MPKQNWQLQPLFFFSAFHCNSFHEFTEKWVLDAWRPQMRRVQWMSLLKKIFCIQKNTVHYQSGSLIREDPSRRKKLRTGPFSQSWLFSTQTLIAMWVKEAPILLYIDVCDAWFKSIATRFQLRLGSMICRHLWLQSSQNLSTSFLQKTLYDMGVWTTFSTTTIQN